MVRGWAIRRLFGRLGHQVIELYQGQALWTEGLRGRAVLGSWRHEEGSAFPSSLGQIKGLVQGKLQRPNLACDRRSYHAFGLSWNEQQGAALGLSYSCTPADRVFLRYLCHSRDPWLQV